MQVLDDPVTVNREYRSMIPLHYPYIDVRRGVGKLPAQYRNVDLSQTKLSTIGDTTKELVSNLDQDVTIYQIAESGSENETIQKLLERYEGLSSHVKVETNTSLVEFIILLIAFASFIYSSNDMDNSIEFM